MANSVVTIETNDCYAFDPKWNDVLYHFSEQNPAVSVFNISGKQKPEEPLINYNFQDKKWHAGRYIGNVNFTLGKKDYSIHIRPRFGDTVLLQMFEELFNIKFSSGNSSFKTTYNSYYLKLLISFIWLQKLANANRHGLPRIKCMDTNEGYTVKGRISLQQSIVPIHETGKVVSARKEKVFDNVVIRILYKAYGVLTKEYQLGLLKIPANALDAIQNIKYQNLDNRFISQYEYQSIRYHPIYQNYKDVIDFSWQIIQTQPGYSNNNTKSNVSGFFLDMAEIWECYVRAIIKKHFQIEGWQIVESQYEIYSERFYRRKIIPDIVIKKGESYCVFDAKYKDMKYRQGFTDVDRDDFFQIHTYIAYLQSKGSVILGGLLYPSTGNGNFVEIKPTQLFGSDYSATHFVVDGPDVTAESINSIRFLSNISNHITVKYAEAQ
jgi:5-methylcytosine-specific restriction endonuclease McrBC regulatory subunit McrC